MNLVRNRGDAQSALPGSAKPGRSALRADILASPPAGSPRTFFTWPRYLFGRLILFAVLLALDCLLRSSLPHTETFLAPVASFGIAAFAVFLGLSYPVLRSSRAALPFHAGFFFGHLGALAALCLESAAAATGLEPAFFSPLLLLLLRIALTVAAVAQLALAVIPLPQWMRLRRATGSLWLYASLAGSLAWILRSPLQSLWNSHHLTLTHLLQGATFAAVSRLLTPILPALQVDAPGFILRAPNFAIYIAPECSGLEGLGLVLVFAVAWLGWFRRDFRFPRALLLIPIALVAVWLLNILRIAALMLIGNSISPEIALAGFHSQAGWIAFTLVALAFSVAAHHIRWLQQTPGVAGASGHAPAPASAAITPDAADSAAESPLTPAYLVPFLAVLATSFLSKAASGAFEWLYPLRLLAALIALACYRRSYREIDLRCSWAAPLAGLALGLLFIVPPGALPGFARALPSDSTGQGLAQLSPAARLLWIGCRTFAAVFTLPIVEELAFRGFLARRLLARKFDTLPYAHLTLLPVLLSSLVYGLLQGSHWLAGIAAGVVFAVLARRHNRLGDAIAAHATANLLIAVWIITHGSYGLW